MFLCVNISFVCSFFNFCKRFNFYFGTPVIKRMVDGHLDIAVHCAYISDKLLICLSNKLKQSHRF